MMKNEKGVALATLVIAVIVMLTITGTITYKSLDSIKLRRLDDMYNDIRLLNQKITSYYIENNDIPILEGVTISKTQVESNNPNDSSNYFIIDLEKLGGISLKYGKEYKEYAADNTKRDIYIINEKTHTVYYLNGLKVKVEGIDVTKYALEARYEEIVLPTPTPEETDILPSEYQEVEYIESTGTQYIDTEVVPNNRIGFKIKMSLPEIKNDTFRFGCRQNTEETRFVLASSNGAVYFGFDGLVHPNAGLNEPQCWNIDVDVPFTASLNFLNNRLANVNGLDSMDIGTLSTNFTYSLIMFGRNSSGTISSSAQKVYSCKITNGNDIIRDFIPCYRKSDNVAGLYDLENNEFYTNDGTGEFNVGNNVE